MTKDNQGAGPRIGVLSRKGSKVYQRVTGNEGPSPSLKRYLKARKARQKEQPAQLVRDKQGKAK